MTSGNERQAEIVQYSDAISRNSTENAMQLILAARSVPTAVHRGTVTYSAHLQSGVHAIPATSLWRNSLWSVQAEWTHQ
jgi:hypothetical protein